MLCAVRNPLFPCPISVLPCAAKWTLGAAKRVPRSERVQHYIYASAQLWWRDKRERRKEAEAAFCLLLHPIFSRSPEEREGYGACAGGERTATSSTHDLARRRGECACAVTVVTPHTDGSSFAVSCFASAEMVLYSPVHVCLERASNWAYNLTFKSLQHWRRILLWVLRMKVPFFTC